MTEPINYGVIEGARNTDYVAGSLPYEIRVKDGNWKKYLPTGEHQKLNGVETMACVSFSANNSVEMQMKFYGVERNLSDRFLATMSGTTSFGNYLWRVADTLRKEGAVDESDWATPEGNFTWNQYYTPVPIPIINKAKLFLNEWDIAYEWIGTDIDSLKHHLKHAPIQVVIPGHAIVNFFCEDDIIHYFDTYKPFEKKTKSITSALKIVVTPKKEKMKLIQKQGENFLWAIIDGKRYWVANPHSRDTIGYKVEIGDPYVYPYVSQVAFLNADEPK